MDAAAAVAAAGGAHPPAVFQIAAVAHLWHEAVEWKPWPEIKPIPGQGNASNRKRTRTRVADSIEPESSPLSALLESLGNRDQWSSGDMHDAHEFMHDVLNLPHVQDSVQRFINFEEHVKTYCREERGDIIAASGSEHAETNIVLHLHFDEAAGSQTVQQMIERALSENQLDGTLDRPECKTAGAISFTIRELHAVSDYIILEFNRFRGRHTITKRGAVRYTNVKNVTDIDRPLEAIRIGARLLSPIAAVIHIGSSAGRGHYVAVVLESGPQGETEWYEYDDDSRRLLKGASITNRLKTAYMILYRDAVLPQVRAPPFLPLRNCGNTCYQNAVVQFLRQTPLVGTLNV